MTRMNNPYTYFKYFLLIFPLFVLLSCSKKSNNLEPNEIKTYLVTFNVNGGSAVVTQRVAEGGKVVKPANDPIRDSYIFVGWYAVADGTGKAFNFDSTVIRDLTLHAIWREKTYTVTFNTDGGSTEASQIVIEGGKIVKPTEDPTKGGYVFVGWYADADGTGAVFDFTTAVTRDLIIYAIWEEKTYTVIFNTDGGSTVVDQIIAEGRKIATPTNPTKGGLIFVGWYENKNGRGTAFDFNTDITYYNYENRTNITLYAIWADETKTYTITFDTDEGSAVESQTVIGGGKITKPINPTKGDLIFVGWYENENGSGAAFNFNTNITDYYYENRTNITLYAIWADNTKIYTITFNTDGGSTIDGQRVAGGGKVIKPIDPTKGDLIFVGWYENENGSGAAFDFNTNITDYYYENRTDITLYAIWADKTKTYTITFDTTGGSNEASQRVAGGGKIVSPTENPTKSGQVFIGWTATADGSGTVFDFDTAVTRDLTLYAIWNVKTYTVTFNTDGGSSVENQRVAEGEKVARPTENPTRRGRVFIGWTANADGSGMVFDFDTAVTRDLTLYAIWNVKTYTVTFNTDEGSSVENQRVADGEGVVKPTEDPTKGDLIFVGWTANTDGSGTIFDFATAVTGDLILYAIWADKTKTYTITFDTNEGSVVESQRVAGGGKIVKPINPTKSNLIFVGWYESENGGGTIFDFTTTVTRDLRLYAIWADNTKIYTITFNTDGGSTIESQRVAGGGKIIRPINPTKGDLIFVGWTANTDGSGAVFNFDTNITDYYYENRTNITLYAIWADNTKTYTITFDTAGDSNEASQRVVGGEKIARPTNPTKSGQVFIGWTANADGSGMIFDFDTAVTRDLTLYAIWNVKTYTITFDTTGGSNEASQRVAEGEKIARPTENPTKSGQVFIGWTATADGSGTVFDFDTAVTRDLTLYAIWNVKTYTITFDTTGGSNEASQRVAEGEKIARPTENPTKSGQVFVGWTATADGSGTVFDFDTAVTRDLTLYAIWNVKTYTVTFNTDGGSSVENQRVAEGEKVARPTENPTRRGRVFIGWTANADGSGMVFDFDTAVTRDLTLYAIWNVKTYTVTFNTDEGSSVENQRVADGEGVVKPTEDPTKGDLIFVGWTANTDGSGTIFDFATAVTGDLILYAIWADKTKTYTITFDTNEGSVVESQRVAGGGKIVKPINPTKSNLIFVGWYESENGGGTIFDFTTTVTRDLRLYAIWADNTKIYTITFNTDGGSTIESQRVAGGGKIIRPINPTKGDLIFVGWTANTDGSGAVFNFDTNITDYYYENRTNITLYAIWADNTKTYTITFDTAGDSNEASQRVVGGEKIARPTNPTKSGQVFIGWTANADGSGMIFDFDTAVTRDLTLYAIWNVKTYTITFDTTGGSNEASQRVAEGEKIARPTENPTKSGQVFIGWTATADGSGTVFDFDTAVTRDLTLYAIWNVKTYTITFDTTGGSNEASQRVAEGEKIARPTENPTKSGQVFIGWTATADGSGTVFDFDTAVTRDLTLYAIWNVKTYTITFDTTGGSNEASQRVAEGEKIARPTENPTKSGQVFVGWTATADGSGTVFDFDTAVTRDLTLYAIWNVKTYTVTFNTDGGSSVENQRVAEGEKVARPTENPTRRGRVFIGWTANADGSGMVFDFDTAVTRDLTLYAIWNVKTYTVTFNTDEGSSVENQRVADGEGVVKPTEDPTKGDLIFVGWTANTDGSGTIFDFATAVTGDLILYAIWADKTKTYTITFDTNEGSVVESQRVAGGGKIVKPINPTKSNLIFVGWYESENGGGTIFDFTTTVTRDLRLYAIWADNTKIYTITFNTDGGSTIESQRVAGGGKIIRPINPTKGDLIFVGWTANTDGSGAVFNFDTNITDYYYENRTNITLYAIWADNTKTYTITFDTAGDSNEASQRVVGGEKIARPTNPTKSGQVFIGWTANADGSGMIFDFDTAVTRDLTLYAIWNVKTYTITFDTTGGSNEASQRVAEGEKIARPTENPTKSGQVFIGWTATADGSGTVFDFDTAVTRDLTLYAIWNVKTYTITFDTNEGSVIDNQRVVGGEKIARPTNPTKSGQVFIGWTANADGSGMIFDFDTAVTRDLTLYAIWNVKTYTITFDTTGGSNEASQRVAEGEKIARPTENPTKSGQVFIGWTATADGSGMVFDFDTAVTRDLTLYAIWNVKTYTVTFNTDEGSSVENQRVADGEGVVKPTEDPTKGDLIFVGWNTTADGTGVFFDFDSIVTEDLTLYAIWRVKTYTVTFNTDEGSSVENQRVAGGEKVVTPTENPTKDNLIFVGWNTTADGTGVFFDFDSIVTEDLTLYAIWRVKTYTVTFNTDEGSTVENQTIAEGEKIVPPTENPTKSGQVFVGWTANADGSGTVFDFDSIVTEDLTLYAIWRVKTYTVTFNTDEGSTVENQTIAEGEKIVPPTENPTKSGQVFVGWTANTDGSGTVFDFDTAVTGDLTLYAIWSVKTYTITFNTDEGSSVENQRVAERGKIVKPINPTRSNLIFVGWYANADGSGTVFNFDSSIVIEDLTLYAIWDAKTYTVTFDANDGQNVSEQKIEPGDKATFVGVSQATKAFIWWYTSANFEVDTRYDFDQEITENINLYARWEEASRYTISEDKITHISDASDIVEIPYNVGGVQIKGLEENNKGSILILNNSIVTNLENKTVKRIIIPNGITRIGDSAFTNSRVLESITIPNSVTNIGFGAFRGCISLTSITIPDNVTDISSNIFSECNKLTSITIPENVTSIGDSAFFRCSITSITIPENVTSIGDYAFGECPITSITIPENVTSIGNSAFTKCPIRSITIPSKVTVIGSEAFRDCSDLESVIIPNDINLAEISEGVFRGCSALTSITIPESVTKIGFRAFRDCSGLVSITIPSRVTDIDPGAFALTTKLKELRIEATVPPELHGRIILDDREDDLSITVPPASVEAYKTDFPKGQNPFSWSRYADRIEGY